MPVTITQLLLPSQVPSHRNLQGRDILRNGEPAAPEGSPIAYYTLFINNHSAKGHPAWRMQDSNGSSTISATGGTAHSGDYRAFTKAQVSE